MLLHVHLIPVMKDVVKAGPKFVWVAVKFIAALYNPNQRTYVIDWTFPYRLSHRGLQPTALAQIVLGWAHDGLNVDNG